MFAEQCAAYLERAAAQTRAVEEAAAASNGAIAPLDEPNEAETPAPNDRGDDGASQGPGLRAASTTLAAEEIQDGIEIDLSGMLDERVFQQLSEAIETVSRDSARAAAPGTRTGEVWTPSSLGSAAVWPAMDFASDAQPNPRFVVGVNPIAVEAIPARKPIQDEWGFFRSGAVRLLGAARPSSTKSRTWHHRCLPLECAGHGPSDLSR